MPDAVTLASNPRFTLYFQFSGLAILAFDYCLKEFLKIIWTWGRPWNFVRALFLLARYAPFILLLIYICATLGAVPIAECSILLTEVALWLSVIAIMSAECLLIIRTWVIWGKRRAVLIGLIALGLACIAADLTVAHIGSRAVIYTPPSSASNCFHRYDSPTYFMWTFIILIVFELVILFLTFSRIFRYKHHRRIFLIMRNDMIYVMCILGISVINTAVTKAL
ncbi:hypothetical protein BJ138DRAFT_394552 [Hygrophoropsis aurantiaca]|uniref:Uncharacterized protein n=1 Tax=Hygrophoropsis aurantiaca TaxID=72124 RepID=A0ACB8A470_9AGAM|nr:hypothetical protein BJ138DRAFT_394552 [Hygrophoropsis aurantiaca]